MTCLLTHARWCVRGRPRSPRCPQPLLCSLPWGRRGASLSRAEGPHGPEPLICTWPPGQAPPHGGTPRVRSVCVWPVPGSSPNPARSQDTVALPGTRHTQHGARRPCSHRLLRRWCAVSSRRENVFLAFGEHFSFLFHLNKSPATFQNRTKKGQGQGAAEVSHLCETAPQCASPGLWVDGHGGSLGWRCPARSAVRFHLGSGDGDRVREWAGLPLLVCGPRGGEPAGPGQRRPRRPRGAGVGAETGSRRVAGPTAGLAAGPAGVRPPPREAVPLACGSSSGRPTGRSVPACGRPLSRGRALSGRPRSECHPGSLPCTVSLPTVSVCRSFSQSRGAGH